MGHPLIDRLTTELGWSRVTSADEATRFAASPGAHVIFVPGDWERNLETTDVAVILPELHRAFQGRFDCAVATGEGEAHIKEDCGVFKTPSLVFYREGAGLGVIAKVRDWDDYIARISRLLDQPVAAE